MLREPRLKQQDECRGAETVTSEFFKKAFQESPDVVFFDILCDNGTVNLTAAFVDGMISTQIIDDFIIKPIVQDASFKNGVAPEHALMSAVYHTQSKLCDTVEECMSQLLSGSVLVFIDSVKKAAAFEVKGFDKRGISEPSSENVLKGSKESFIEILRTNTAMVRRRLQSRDLIINQMTVGRRSKTAISVVYLGGIANPEIVDAVKSRLAAIDIDGICSPGQIETFLLGRKNSIFPQVLYTERLDKFCGSILEGRIGIIIDGLPTVFIALVDVSSFLQAPEDYALGHIPGSLVRLLRYGCAVAALLLPALYVSMTTFHQEMIPTKLAVSIISNKQGVPFPSYIETLLMLLAFEVLLEAGLRLPNAVGSAVSIVGGLVVGQAAISAGILSPGVVIVIAAAGISGFVIPSQDLSNAIRILRAALVLLSIIGGLFTVTLGIIAIVLRMCTLETFGVPYLSPFAAADGRGMFSDTIVTTPWNKAKTRPGNISPGNIHRQGGWR